MLQYPVMLTITRAQSYIGGRAGGSSWFKKSNVQAIVYRHIDGRSAMA